MSIDFMVGDKVEMINCDNIYGYTKSGSTGEVLEVGETTIRIKFDYLSGIENFEKLGQGWWEFTVSKYYVKLQDSSTTKKTEIERKINLMWNRQPYIKRNKDHVNI